MGHGIETLVEISNLIYGCGNEVVSFGVES